MGEITEVFEDIREKIGDKWFFIFIGVAVLFGLYNLVKNPADSGGELTTVTGVTSYPDVVTNANVVIDTLQDSLQYTEDRITERIDASYEDLGIQMGTNFEATNDYINKGFESQKEMLETNFDEIHGTLETNFDEIKTSQAEITGHINTMKEDIKKNTSSIKSLKSSVSSLSSRISSSKSSGGSSSTGGSSSSGGASSSGGSSSSGNLKYTTKAGLNTNTSIVDALKATGTDSSFENRAEIYYKNGGTGTYTGSYSQNVNMLNKLKSGNLKA